MKRGFLDIAGDEARRLGRDESGIAVMFVLCSFLFLFIVSLSVWFFGENIRRKAELQNVCDAAAYSAATVQADGLSRMAVINRAMSWSYIQMTKMQMDYITLRWLELTKERFEKDRRNTDPTPLGRMFTHKAGYHTFEHEWKKVPWLIRAFLKYHGIGFNIGAFGIQLKFGFDCQDDLHNEPHKGSGSYQGFRPMWYSGNWLERETLDTISLNKPIASQSDLGTTETLMKKTELNSTVNLLQGEYGVGGESLRTGIVAMKNAITTFNALLPLINRQMATAIEETAVKTLYENLPRDNEGNIDQSILKDYRWTVAGGVSKPPAQYPSGSGGLDTVDETMCAIDSSYFSGLRNTEEDEMIFLNMADGLPEHLKGREVRLVDYFANPDAAYRDVTASGLDQWFIRCDPAESALDKVVVERNFDKVPNGIVRAYKNANYDEGKSATSLIQKAFGNAFDGIHRGNYTTDLGELINTRAFRTGLNSDLSSHVQVTSKPKHPWRHPKKYFKHKATSMTKRLVGMLDGPFARFMDPIRGTLNRVLNLVDKLQGHLFSLDIEPSCVNDRLRFVDQCSNVRNTTGLVSQYEWGSAYWFCNWGKLEVTFMGVKGKFKWCVHPFVPVAALHGGRKDAKAESPVHTVNEKGTDAYGVKNGWKEINLGITRLGIPGLWLNEEIRMFTKKGHRRGNYHSSFISVDGDLPGVCYDHNTWWYLGINGGQRSGYLLKGFVRIYGDDKAVYNSCYQGVPARPWILNEKYFQGGGSIIVGISRKQRNVFDWIVDAARESDPLATAESPSLYSAFSPVKEPEQHFVALAAARAGYAPRTGYSRAEGTDSVNGGSRPARRFEVRYDAVLDKQLGVQGNPLLPQNVEGLDETARRQIEQDARIGCVCGTPNTTKRLRHEWNLSQTDWDAVLLPLRHAYAKHTHYDSANPTTTKWDFPNLTFLSDSLTDDERLSRLTSYGDSIDKGVGHLLFGRAKWHTFKGRDAFGRDWLNFETDKTLKTKEVIPLPKGAGTPEQLFRRRRIL